MSTRTEYRYRGSDWTSIRPEAHIRRSRHFETRNIPDVRLRPYHNPQNVDESEVPPGWRFRYADEQGWCFTACRAWKKRSRTFSSGIFYLGILPDTAYIVPV